MTLLIILSRSFKRLNHNCKIGFNSAFCFMAFFLSSTATKVATAVTEKALTKFINDTSRKSKTQQETSVCPFHKMHLEQLIANIISNSVGNDSSGKFKVIMDHRDVHPSISRHRARAIRPDLMLMAPLKCISSTNEIFSTGYISADNEIPLKIDEEPHVCFLLPCEVKLEACSTVDDKKNAMKQNAELKPILQL